MSRDTGPLRDALQAAEQRDQQARDARSGRSYREPRAAAATVNSQIDVQGLTAALGAALDWADRHAARACGESLTRAMYAARNETFQ